MFVSRLNPVAQHAFQRLMAPEKPSYLASYSTAPVHLNSGIHLGTGNINISMGRL